MDDHVDYLGAVQRAEAARNAEIERLKAALHVEQTINRRVAEELTSADLVAENARLADAWERTADELKIEWAKREAAEKDRDEALIHLGRLVKETQSRPTPGGDPPTLDRKALAERIADAMAEPIYRIESTADRQWIADCYDDLKRTTSFFDSARQARGEWVERVLGEMPRPVPSPDRDALGRIAFDAWWEAYTTILRPGVYRHHAETWEGTEENIREINRRVADAVVAAVPMPRPAAIVRTADGHVHGFASYSDGVSFYSTLEKGDPSDPNMTRVIVGTSGGNAWHWHPAAPSNPGGDTHADPPA